MNEKPDFTREGWNVLTDPDEIVFSVPDEAGQSGHTHSCSYGDQVLADVVQFASHGAFVGNAEQPLLLRHVGKVLIKGDELPPFCRGQMSIGSVRVKAKGHRSDLSRYDARFVRPRQSNGNVRFAAAKRYLLALGRK